MEEGFVQHWCIPALIVIPSAVLLLVHGVVQHMVEDGFSATLVDVVSEAMHRVCSPNGVVGGCVESEVMESAEGGDELEALEDPHQV